MKAGSNCLPSKTPALLRLSERINVAKIKNSGECIVFHYWFFNYAFKFQNSVWNCCRDYVVLIEQVILLLLLLNVLILVILFMTLANLEQLIY